MTKVQISNDSVINDFILQITLIDPVTDIINKLSNGDFRDCDIKWLDKKLDNYMIFASNTLNIKGLLPQRESVKPNFINTEYAIQYYSKYFSQLLSFFNSLKN